MEHLHKALDSAEGKKRLDAFGLTKDDLGSHSSRKGPATYSTSGSTGGPSIVSILRRGRWKIGNGTWDRYFKYEAAGDNFAGRVIAGLNLESDRFSILPPHFAPDSVTDDEMKRIFPSAPSGASPAVLRLTLASLVFHHNFLSGLVPKRDKFRYSSIFTNKNLRKDLSNRLIIGFESPCMRATGIPPHVSILCALRAVRIELKDLTPKIVEQIGEVLEKNGAAVANITPNGIHQVIKQSITEILREHFQPPHHAEIHLEPDQNGENNQILPNTYYVYKWGNGVHNVPEDFEFPTKCDIPTAFRLWHLGDPGNNIPPYSILTPHDMSTKKKRHSLSEYKCLVEALILAIGDDYTSPDEEELLTAQLNLGFSRLFGDLEKKYRSRRDKWSVFTAMKEIRALRKSGDVAVPAVEALEEDDEQPRRSFRRKRAEPEPEPDPEPEENISAMDIDEVIENNHEVREADEPMDNHRTARSSKRSRRD